MDQTMTPTLERVEVESVTGYKRPADQLAELHRQGFFRARQSPTTGRIILERAHYDAVCVGAITPRAPKVRTPTVRQPRA